MKYLFFSVLILLAFSGETLLAVDYCRDCDRPIADGKEYCNKCQEVRTRNAAAFFNSLLGGNSGGEKAARERREKADRKIRAQTSRMDDIIRTNVLWNADSKTDERKYFYRIRREDGGPLYAYVGDDYSKADISGKWFAAKALSDSPTLLKERAGMLRILIRDDLDNYYELSKVKPTWNGAKTMTLHITEQDGGRIRCRIWTGHWHKRGDEEVSVVFDKVLKLPDDRTKHYLYPVEED